MLLVFDLYMTFLLLRLTAALTHTRLRFWRAMLGAAAGSLSSLLVLLPPMPFVLTLLCKLLSAVLFRLRFNKPTVIALRHSASAAGGCLCGMCSAFWG